jgi:hypothetical protein
MAVPSIAAAFSVSGQVTDVLTGDGIDGLVVRLGSVADTTRSGGRFRVEGAEDLQLSVDGESLGFSIYTTGLGGVPSETRLAIPLIPLGPLRSGYYRNLLHYLRMMTGTGEPSRRAQDDVSISYDSSPRSTTLRRWNELPIPIHVPPYRAKGFSWDEVIRRAMARWEEATGLDLFWEVRVPGDAQVRVRYEGAYSKVVFERATLEGIPLAASLWMSPELDERDNVRSSAEHELGHILLLLVHSEDPGHVMYWGGSRGREISNDEALAVRCLFSLPNLTEMSAYLERAPLTEEMKEKKRILAVVLLQAMVALFVILAAH